MDKNSRNSNPIKQWLSEDRPRGKLLVSGAHSLTDSELLAIILGSGTKGQSALDISRIILKELGGLQNLLKANPDQWEKIKGLGTAKIASIKAALEMGLRLNEQIAANPTETFISAQSIVDKFVTRTERSLQGLAGLPGLKQLEIGETKALLTK